MKFRFFILISSTTLAFLFVALHLYKLQVNQGDHYAQLAQASRVSEDFLLPRRGTIYFTDSRGDKVQAAITKEYTNVFAVPNEIVDAALTAGEIQQVLPELSLEALTSQLEKKGDEYELIARRITDEQRELFKFADIKGIYFETERARYYPLNSVGAQVIGFVGKSEEGEVAHGKYGIESYYDSELTGKPGALADGKLTPPVSGRDIVLTIDREVQVRAEDILERLVVDYRARSGSIVVQNPKTGELIALANYPTFNPNEYADASLSSFTNPVVEGLYEPGSVFKLITMAAGLDSGAVTPQTTYFDTGSITLNGMTVRNWDLKSHGTLTMTEVIEGSINTGTIFAQRKMGQRTFYDYLLRFGFKLPTNIALPGEVVGRLTPLEVEPQEINFATASYGQGISTTPIRLLAAVSALANGGVMKRPCLMKEECTSEEWDVVSKKTARQVTEMMVSTVKKAKVADIPRYEVAGKTGTAFIPENGKYSDDVINTYAGFAPAYNPRFSILIKLERPEGAPLAGQTVVPAFRELAEFLLNYYHVPPSDL